MLRLKKNIKTRGNFKMASLSDLIMFYEIQAFICVTRGWDLTIFHLSQTTTIQERLQFKTITDSKLEQKTPSFVFSI